MLYFYLYIAVHIFLLNNFYFYADIIFFQKSAHRLGNWEMQENGLIQPCEQCEYAAAKQNPLKTHTAQVFT